MPRITRDEQLAVHLSGDIDLSNVDEMKRTVDQAVQECPLGFVIDLSEVQYIDSAGIQVILAAYQQVYRNGGELTVVVKTRNIKEILHLIHLEAFPGINLREEETEGA